DEESVSFEDKRVTKVKAFMAIPEDEPSVGKERKHFLDYTHVDLYYVGDQMKNLLRKFNSLNEELSSCKSKLNDLKNTKSLNCSLQNEIIRLNLENDSLKDEITDLKNVIEKWTSSKVTLDQLLTEQVPGNIVRALGGRGKKKDTISSKEVLFSKATESPSETILKISSNSESECDNLELFPPLPKLTRVEPIGTSADVLTLSDLTLTPVVFEELKKFPDKKSAIKALKKKTQTMSPSVLYPIPFKKANSSTEQLLLTLMEEVKGDTDGYGLVNYNGITFIRVAYVNGLKHNLISMSQLCDVNFKVLFIKTQGTIFNQNNEVVLIAQRRRDVYVIDMSSYNEESNKKSDATDCTMSFIRKMENLNEVRVKELRIDNRTEFRNHKLEEFCDEKGISHLLAPLNKMFWREAVNTACYIQNIYIIVKRHGKTSYEVFRGRSPHISYFHMFGYHVHIHNHIYHLGKFDAKADDGFFLGYSLVAKAIWVFNIRRQEMEETFHVTYSEDDEAISKSSTEGDEIYFNENRSFPDDEFLVPRRKVSQSSSKDDYFPYVPTYDSLSTNNITIPGHITPNPLNINSPDDSHVFTIPDDHHVHNADNFKLAEIYVDDIIFGSTSDKLSKQFAKLMTKNYEMNLLKKYDLADSTSVKCHMLPPNNLGPDESRVFVNETLFRGMIGSLMYLTASRPDIQFSTCLYARPLVSKRIRLRSESIFRPDYPGCNLDRKSTLGIKSQLADYDILYENMPIFCDYTSAIAISNNPVLHSRTKHIDIRYHFIRDHISKGDIELHFIPTNMQLADIFTKPLAETSFTRLVAELGMLNRQKEVPDKKKALSDPLT
ncbi:retrovirus-related pol polyprotein from transposon TNT 1-94, partial [Tanacetum coccineum]